LSCCIVSHIEILLPLSRKIYNKSVQWSGMHDPGDDGHGNFLPYVSFNNCEILYHSKFVALYPDTLNCFVAGISASAEYDSSAGFKSATASKRRPTSAAEHYRNGRGNDGSKKVRSTPAKGLGVMEDCFEGKLEDRPVEKGHKTEVGQAMTVMSSGIADMATSQSKEPLYRELERREWQLETVCEKHDEDFYETLAKQSSLDEIDKIDIRGIRAVVLQVWTANAMDNAVRQQPVNAVVQVTTAGGRGESSTSTNAGGLVMTSMTAENQSELDDGGHDPFDAGMEKNLNFWWLRFYLLSFLVFFIGFLVFFRNRPIYRYKSPCSAQIHRRQL
jgi:hypothetical protein